MQSWRASEAYNELPALPPVELVVTAAIQAHTVLANIEIAKLQQILDLLPNSNLFVSTIPIVEAQASSAIENIVTTNDTLFKELASNSAASIDPITTAVWANRAALLQGFTRVANRPIGKKVAKEICGIILGHEVEVRDRKGTYIGSAQEIRYTPPSGASHIENLLDNWEAFLNTSSDLDPLIVLAISHYQFEAIHPFFDGNGRTGRILNALYLVQCGLLQNPALHISRSINRNRNTYYELLLRVTSVGDWEAWILFMLRMIAESAVEAQSQVKEIDALIAQAYSQLVGNGVKVDNAKKLSQLIFENPYSRQHMVVEKLGVTRPTAAKLLTLLQQLELVKPVSAGREKYYVNEAMLRVLA